MMKLWDISMIIRENTVKLSMPGCITFNMKVYSTDFIIVFAFYYYNCHANIKIIPCNHFDSIITKFTSTFTYNVLSFHRDGPCYAGQLCMDRLNAVTYYSETVRM